MNMTREDVLRELELLPVWQLRAPSTVNLAATQHPAPILQAPISDEKASEQTLNEQTPSEISLPNLNLRMLMTDDAQYLFLLAPLQTSDEETLLQNMFKAMQAKTRMDIGLQSISDLSVYAPKIIIAMGEAASNALGLLGTPTSPQPFNEARGQIQQTKFGLVALTFSPAHLIHNAADKALAWHDLCLAKLTIEAL